MKVSVLVNDIQASPLKTGHFLWNIFRIEKKKFPENLLDFQSFQKKLRALKVFCLEKLEKKNSKWKKS